MPNPVPLNPTGEISEFFEFLYGDVSGFVYAPTKDPNTAEWTKHFFQWPNQRADLIKHCLNKAASVEVYCGPALYKQPSGQKQDVLGTHVYWTEFDGTLPNPEALGEVPAPTRRIRSSEAGHEHFYWRLDTFQTNVDAIEQANRGLAYLLQADTSAWDANQVLRPVSTYNHKRAKPVLTVARSGTQLSPDLFSSVPVPSQVVSDVDIASVPDTLEVVASYKWTKEDFDFFRKTEIPSGKRSSALMRLGHICCEMRMSDAEAFAIIYNADERWGKFKDRPDRKRRLLDIINKARLVHPLNPVVPEDDYTIFNFEDFLAVDIQVDWLIPGLLQEQGYLLMSGPPGTGKTQLSMQWAIHMALGKDFLGWSAGEPSKLLFVSMEMAHADLKFFVEQMATELTVEERSLLRDNLHILPLGHGIILDKPEGQQAVEAMVEKLAPRGVFFDSLGMVTTEELTDERTVKVIMDWQARLRADRNVFTWFLHHNRKAQSQNKKPNKLADVYGSQYITSYATTVIGLWPVGTGIEVNALKVRLAEPFPQFKIQRSGSLNFARSDAPVVFEQNEEPDEGPTALGLGL